MIIREVEKLRKKEKKREKLRNRNKDV